MKPNLRIRLTAEFIGTAFLVAAVVGSGIMGERLAEGNVAVALLANTIATGAALVALILTFGPISGAHFNPVVTLSLAARKIMPWREVPPYVSIQVIGAILGTLAAHVMFGKELYSLSHHQRSGVAQLVFLQTPPISLSGVTPGSVVLSFDSSFRPYQAMTGLVDVSFNGGTTFANVLTLKPLAYRDPHRVAFVLGWNTPQQSMTFSLRVADFADLTRQARSLNSVAAYAYWSANFTGGDVPERVQAYRVTANTFSLLDLPPVLGRTLTGHDGVPGAPGVVVISHGLWQRRFGASRSVIGAF